MSDFVKDSFEEIDQIEKDKLDADERVKKLITSQETQIGSINVGGAEIKFKLFLPKSVRHKLMKSKTSFEGSSDESSLIESEKVMYEMLSLLCIEEPWNKWETWAYIDEKSEKAGGVQSVFMQVLSHISSSAEDVKNFRRKQ